MKHCSYQSTRKVDNERVTVIFFLEAMKTIMIFQFLTWYVTKTVSTDDNYPSTLLWCSSTKLSFEIGQQILVDRQTLCVLYRPKLHWSNAIMIQVFHLLKPTDVWKCGGWMGGWVNGWMDGQLNGQTGRQYRSDPHMSAHLCGDKIKECITRAKKHDSTHKFLLFFFKVIVTIIFLQTDCDNNNND